MSDLHCTASLKLLFLAAVCTCLPTYLINTFNQLYKFILPFETKLLDPSTLTSCGLIIYCCLKFAQLNFINSSIKQGATSEVSIVETFYHTSFHDIVIWESSRAYKLLSFVIIEYSAQPLRSFDCLRWLESVWDNQEMTVDCLIGGDTINYSLSIRDNFFNPEVLTW